MFSPSLVDALDYVFTDAMTWTDENGTNNTNAENPENLVRAVQMVDQQQLQPADMFLPSTD